MKLIFFLMRSHVIFSESLTSYPELAFGLYMVCALLGFVVILLTICLLKSRCKSKLISMLNCYMMFHF